MYVEKNNFLNIVKHDIAKTKIQAKLSEKSLTEYDIIHVQRTIHCERKRVSYKVILRDECFTIFDDGTELMKKNDENITEQCNEANTMSDTVDLSWMWHCSDNPKNVLDYTELIEDKNVAIALNRAAAVGFRAAMRKMEDLNIIQMADIDRSPKHEDQLKWNNYYD